MALNNINLLQDLVSIIGPSGNEGAVRDYIINYVKNNQHLFKVKPILKYGKGFQDSLILVFGKPRTALFAHMDTIGFTVRYNNTIVPIGSPTEKTGYVLIGEDETGPIEAKIVADPEFHFNLLDFPRPITPGTELLYKVNFRETHNHISTAYLDNRLGVYMALMLCHNLENGAIVFSCLEEHYGGSVGYLSRYLYEELQVNQAIISDITWVSQGVFEGEGPAVTIRDGSMPRRAFVNHCLELAKESGLKYQPEVEGQGGSDGKYIQQSTYPIDWCFVGPPIHNVHTPDEKVNKADVEAAIQLYEYLMQKL